MKIVHGSRVNNLLQMNRNSPHSSLHLDPNIGQGHLAGKDKEEIK